MPGADYGLWARAADTFSKQFLRLLSPGTGGAAPAHTPGREEPPTQLPGGPQLLTPGGPRQALTKGQSQTATHQHDVRPELHDRLMGSSSVPPALGRRLVPPGSTYASVHAQSANSWARDPFVLGSRHFSKVARAGAWGYGPSCCGPPSGEETLLHPQKRRRKLLAAAQCQPSSPPGS